MGKKSVDSIVRAQAAALSDSGLNQVQLSRQLNISTHCVQNAVKKYKKTRQYNVLTVQKEFQIVAFDI